MAGLTVMIVEDDDGLRRMFQRVIEAGGHTVLTAPDGREALRQLETAPPHVMLLDVQLPYVSGVEVMDYLAAHPALHGIHVVLMSSVSDHEGQVERLPSAQFCLKPVMAAQLREILERVQGGA